MRIAIFGVGAVGGYFGGRLLQAGEDVSFVARGKTLEALQTRGLRLTSPLGDFDRPTLQATDHPATVGVVDLVVVGVKAWQVRDAAEALRPMVGQTTAVLPLQNGVEASSDLAAVLGPRPVLGGVCRIISRVDEPGRVVHVGATPSIELGELDDSRSERVEEIAGVLSQAGVKVRISEDIHAALWEKLTFLATLSGVGAVTRSPVGVLREIPETRQMIERAMREIVAVAAAQGVHLPADTVDKALGFIDALPPDATASMQRDIVAGRPSELEAQSGAIVRLGREAGVAMPVHEFLYAGLLPMERAARASATGSTG
jgi:2-dehydropantoate 2-reductase